MTNKEKSSTLLETMKKFKHNISDLNSDLSSNHRPSFDIINQHLDDVVHFVNKSLKYRDKRSYSQASAACYSLAEYLHQYGENHASTEQ